MTSGSEDTHDDRPPAPGRAKVPTPGLVVLLEGGSQTIRAVPVGAGGATLGREAKVSLDDDRASRVHADVRRGRSGWNVRDLDSRNGTFVDAARVEVISGPDLRVIRVGHSLAVFVLDVTPYEGASVEIIDDLLVGPHLQAELTRVRRLAGVEGALLVTGPSGAGKEIAVRAYHRAMSARAGPLVAVNCASIPRGVAERLLFGAARGAYSGADADTTGHFQAADGGTLFLDEVAELDLDVQAKLLRVLETGEVTPLGGRAAQRVDVRVCSATHTDLRDAVAQGRFREDLYFRIGRPEVQIPPLSARPEEIVAAVQRAALAIGLEPHVLFFEQCLVRPWPGNFRELLTEVRRAGHEASADGRQELLADDLGDTAGTSFGAEPDPGTPDRDAIEQALADEGGNVSAAARRLGLHRTQLRRWMKSLDL